MGEVGSGINTNNGVFHIDDIHLPVTSQNVQCEMVFDVDLHSLLVNIGIGIVFYSGDGVSVC